MITVPALRTASAAVAAASILLAGCSGGGRITTAASGAPAAGASGSAPSAEVVLTAATLQQAAKTAQEATSGRFEVTFGKGASGGTASGSAADGRILGEFSGDTARTTVGTAAAAGGAPGDAEVETIATADALFVRGNFLSEVSGSEGPGGANQWYRIGLDGLGESGLARSLGAQVSGADVVRVLDGAYGEVERVGTDTVRGAEATHYRVTVDPKKVAESLGAADAFGTVVDGLGDQDRPQVDVWVGADKEIRRVSLADGAVVAEIWDLGAKIDIAPPTDAKDFDLGDVLSGVLGK